MIKAPKIFLLGFVSIWLLGAGAESPKGGGTIRGSIYISPSGQAEGDLVMRGVDIEVILLRADKGFESELEALRQRRAPVIAKQLQAVSRAQEEFLRAATLPRQEREQRSSRLREHRAKLLELREAYAEEVAALMTRHAAAKTRTDAEGKFALTGLASAPYIVHSHFEIVGMDIHYYWLVNADLRKEDTIEVSLTKLNATALY